MELTAHFAETRANALMTKVRMVLPVTVKVDLLESIVKLVMSLTVLVFVL